MLSELPAGLQCFVLRRAADARAWALAWAWARAATAIATWWKRRFPLTCKIWTPARTNNHFPRSSYITLPYLRFHFPSQSVPILTPGQRRHGLRASFPGTEQQPCRWRAKCLTIDVIQHDTLQRRTHSRSIPYQDSRKSQMRSRIVAFAQTAPSRSRMGRWVLGRTPSGRRDAPSPDAGYHTWNMSTNMQKLGLDLPVLPGIHTQPSQCRRH